MPLCNLATEFYIFLINLCYLVINNSVSIIHAKIFFSELFATFYFFT